MVAFAHRSTTPGVFDVTAYGAVGDGTTNDRVACQAAVTAANAWASTYGKATVFFPAKTFLLNTSTYGVNILQPQSGVRMTGSGLLKCSAASSDNPVIIQVGAYSNVVIEGLRFDNGDNTDGLGVRLDASLYTTIRNCSFDNMGTSGVYIAGASEDTTIDGCTFRGGLYPVLWNDSSTATRTKITGCTFDGLGELSEAIEINTPSGGATDVQIVGNTFTDLLYNGSNTVGGIGIAHAYRVLVEGNVFTGCNTRAIHIENGSQDVSVVGNKFYANTREAVYVVLGSNAMKNFQITGNEFLTCGSGGYHTVYFIPGGAYSPFQNVMVNDNLFVGCGKAGSATSSLQVDGYVANLIVDGNHIAGTLGSTSNLGNGINLEGAFASGAVLVQNNLVTGGANGILMSGAHSITTVRNNYLGGNSTNSLFSNATGTVTITGNQWYKTEAYGTSTIADGGTIAHGLAATPTSWSVQTVTSGEFASASADSTNLTVAIKKHDNSAGTTQAIKWRANV